MITLKTISTPDQNLQIIQSNIQAAVTSIGQSPFVGGNLVTGVVLTSGQDNLVPHGLNRTPVISIPSPPNVQATIWSPTTAKLTVGGNPAASNSTFVNLRTSVTCTVSVWFN